MAMELVDVAIVGGGLGGLALALGLQERGIQAHVFEKAPKVRKRNGTSISLHMNGLRALDGIKPGLTKKLKAKGAQITQVRRNMRLRQGRRVRSRGRVHMKLWRTKFWIKACYTGDTHSSTTTSLREVWRPALKC